MSNSKEYAKFKRLFVGPKLPKKIKKQRGIGSTPMPGEKPVTRRGPLPNYDIRSTRYGRSITQLTTPLWANKSAIKELYLEAKLITTITGIAHEVDHIIPLRGELVCGLHVETNLRIISRADNNLKTNYYLPDSPRH